MVWDVIGVIQFSHLKYFYSFVCFGFFAACCCFGFVVILTQGSHVTQFSLELLTPLGVNAGFTCVSRHVPPSWDFRADECETLYQWKK